MALDPRTPVVVGAGQVTNRPDRSTGADLTARPEPSELMVRAVLAAAEDSTGTSPGTPGGAGHALLRAVDSLRVIEPLTWHYTNPAALVAGELGIAPRELAVSTTGGTAPLTVLHRTALDIGRGRLDAAVIVGAECGHTRAAARRHPDRPVLPWTVEGTGATPPDTVLGSNRGGTTEAEEASGLDRPGHVFPLFENALRAARHRPLDEHRRLLAARWARFAAEAAANPYAWLRNSPSAEEIATPSPDNRMIAYPYTKLLTADHQVDQGAALLVCSLAAAERAGIDRDRWIFPLAGAEASDHWYLSHRADFTSSPAVRFCGRSALDLARLGIDDVGHLDLYSSSPCTVEIAAVELGLRPRPGEGDGGRALTVTGGLTFAGGPGSNYATHAVATMVRRLRSEPGATGLVTGVGWYLSAHAVSLFGSAPPDPDVAAPGAGTTVEAAAGFAVADPQAAVAALPQQVPDSTAGGEVTVETYSVSYDRDGVPERGVAACLTPEGRRAWGHIDDPDQLAMLVSEEGCGRLGRLNADGRVDLR